MSEEFVVERRLNLSFRHIADGRKNHSKYVPKRTPKMKLIMTFHDHKFLRTLKLGAFNIQGEQTSSSEGISGRYKRVTYYDR